MMMDKAGSHGYDLRTVCQANCERVASQVSRLAGQKRDGKARHSSNDKGRVRWWVQPDGASCTPEVYRYLMRLAVQGYR